ncbi:hypothetical protein MKX03_014694, partial [Papaver bracteatum]
GRRNSGEIFNTVTGNMSVWKKGKGHKLGGAAVGVGYGIIPLTISYAPLVLTGESCSGISTSFTTHAGFCNNLARYMLEHFDCDSLILHKTKLCAPALAPFKAYYEGNLGCQNNPKHNMRCLTC